VKNPALKLEKRESSQKQRKSRGKGAEMAEPALRISSDAIFFTEWDFRNQGGKTR